MKDLTALRKKQEQDVPYGIGAGSPTAVLPSATAFLPGFDIAAAAYPADETGGDYFDFIPQVTAPSTSSSLISRGTVSDPLW